MRTWTHDDLARDLATHFHGMTDRVCWLDMQMGPRASARPDVYTMTKSFAHPQFVSYECKISVSDFRSDATTGKWQKYLAFSNAVYFAVPEGLIKKAEIPAHCGLLTRGENGWRSIKKATHSTFTMPQECWLKLLIDGIERQRKPTQEAKYFDSWKQQRAISKKFGESVAKVVLDLAGSKEKVRRAEETAAQMVKGAESQIKEQREKAEMGASTLRGEIAQMLGLPWDSNIHLIKREWHRHARRLTESDEIRHLREQLGTIRNAVNAVDHPAEKAIGDAAC